MITNYIPNTCKYSVNNLKKVVHIFSESENVIHIDNGEAYVTSGITDFQTIYATSVDFAESTSYDDRFKFEKTVTVTCDGFLKLDSLNEKYYLVLEDENHTMWLVNADFPSFVTYTYTLSDGTDETVFTFNVLSNFPTLKLNASINNSYECKDYSLANVKELKMNLKENCTIDHVNHIIYDSSNTPYYIVKFNEGTLKMEEAYDGFNVTTTIEFNINFDDYKASWHYNLLEYQDNKYVAVTDHLAAGFEMGLIPSYNVQGSSQKGQGDIITITLVGTSQKGSEWAEEWSEATLIPDYVWLLSEEWTCYTPPPPPPPAFEGKYKFTLNNSRVVSAECDSSSSITTSNTRAYTATVVSAEIGECITSINDDAFRRCTGLTSVTIPNSVTSIGGFAFSGCTSLPSVTIPSGVTSISGYVLRGCTSLTSVTIPSGVTSIDEAAFGACSSLTGIDIPSGVTEISRVAFGGCSSLTGITLPTGITYIGDYTFWDCESLTSITIPDNVTYIDEFAFERCTGLTSVAIPDSVTSIGEAAFGNCYSLESIGPVDSGASLQIPSGITGISTSLFSGCTGLTDLIIPDSITNIGEHAFSNCSSLSSLTIPNSVTTIENYAFENCDNIKYLNFDTDAVITYRMYGVSLETLIIGDNITSISNRAFWNCGSLTSVTIGTGVTSIGEHAFYGCSSLTSIGSIGSGASIEIPTNVTSIGKAAFQTCYGLSSVTIPDSVTSISDYTFDECTSLSSVTISTGVTYIGYWTFHNCSNLESVTCLATNPPYLVNNAFQNTSNDLVIYVPSASVDAYKSATGWRDYASRIQAIP